MAAEGLLEKDQLPRVVSDSVFWSADRRFTLLAIVKARYLVGQDNSEMRGANRADNLGIYETARKTLVTHLQK